MVAAGGILLAGLLTSCSEAINQNGIAPARVLRAPILSVPSSGQLHGAILRSSDVQSGWTFVQHELPLSVKGTGCSTGLGSLPSPAGRAMVEYRDQQDPVPVLAEGLASYRQSQAASVYSDLVRALDDCRDGQLQVGVTAVGAQVSHAGPLSLGGVANQSYFAVLTGPAAGVHVGVDLFRDGRVLGWVAYSAPTASTSATLNQYAERAVGKLRPLAGP